MHIRLLAVGDRQPSWVDAAFANYANRLPRQWRFHVDVIATAKRAKGASAAAAKATEADRILARIKPAEQVIALDERGKHFSSKAVGELVGSWQAAGDDVVFVIGGPDGLADTLLARANLRWSLSKLTLPHGLARVVFAEQIYRAWSLSTGHPYHRE